MLETSLEALGSIDRWNGASRSVAFQYPSSKSDWKRVGVDNNDRKQWPALVDASLTHPAFVFNKKKKKERERERE